MLAILVERRLLDPEALVATYWPEYATNGKEQTTVAMVASHTAGLPYPRVVPGHWPETSPMTPTDDVAEPGTYAELRQRFLRENPPMDPDFGNADEVREAYCAERPAIGAITDARALATMYAALLAPVDGVRLINDATRAAATRPRTDEVETLIESGTAGPDIRFGLGYQLSSPSMPGFGPSYICSRMRNIGPAGDPRWLRLINAVKASIGA